MKKRYLLLILLLSFVLFGCNIHKHEYEKNIITPTCTEMGYTIFVCECGDTYYDEYVNANGHTYGEWEKVKDATETEQGLMKRVCSICKDESTVTIPVLDHVHKYESQDVLPTCETKGYTVYTCSCGETYTDNEVEALGHLEKVIPGKESTCLEKGLTEGKVCERCEIVLVSQEEIDVKGHTLVIDEKVDSTCATVGKTEGSHCSVCNEVIVKQEEIAKKEHTYGEWIKIKDPTETEEGSLKRICSECNHEEFAIIPVLDHVHSYSVMTYPATCLEKGYDLFLCKCGDNYKNNYTQPLGHKEGVIENVDPTCTTVGYTSGIQCLLCKTVLLQPEEISALGHILGEYQIDVEPTTTTTGLKSKHCDRCSDKVEPIVLPIIEEQVLKFTLINNNTQYLVSGYNESLITNGTVTIPQYFNTFPVVGISDYAFKDCKSLKSIEIPEYITNNGKYIFSGCTSLASIKIPSTILSIGEGWFDGCSSLMTYSIPKHITKIEKYAFNKCSMLIGIVIPESVETIEEYAFNECGYLSGIVLPSKLTVINKGVFKNCVSLVDITLPNSITLIEEEAFLGCTALNTITIPNKVTEIKNNVFSGCTKLETVTLHSNINSIGDYAFYKCSSLKLIEISSNIKTIGVSAFEGCSSLSSIVLYNGTEEIKENAFKDCTNLEMFIIPSSVKVVGKEAFNNNPKLQIICQLPSKPTEWDTNWKGNVEVVIWEGK